MPRLTTGIQATRREQGRLATETEFTQEEMDTIHAAQADFWVFLNTVYADSWRDEEFLYADGEFGPFSLSHIHKVWAYRVAGFQKPDGTVEGPFNRWRVKAPRLHLKSTVLGRGYLFWRFFSEGQDIDAFYFGYKKPLADEHITLLKRDIEKNRYCRFWTDNNPTATSIIDFTVSFREREPNGEPKTWRAEAEGEGIMSATRGRHPKVVLCDDILSDFANPIESVEITRINHIFQFVILNLPPADGTLGVVGTPQSPTDILAKLADNPSFWCAEFPAVGDYETEKVLWPEMWSFKRLMNMKRQIGDSAFEVEFQLKPRQSVDQFLRSDALETCVDGKLRHYEPEAGETFPNPEGYPIYGAMDVGKEIHPSHISMFIELPPEEGQDMGWLVQVYERWLDKMAYNKQVEVVNELMRYFKPTRFHWDSTRSELEDRGMDKSARGVKFKKGIKASMATMLEKRVMNSYYWKTGDTEGAGPGIIFLGPKDSRQVRSMKQMKKDFTASENEDGHGDAFISNMIAVWSCETGPRMKNIGDMQEVFAGHASRRRGQNIFCEHEYEEIVVDDPLGIRPPVRFQKCRHCGHRVG